MTSKTFEGSRSAAMQKSQQLREAKAAICKAMRRGNMGLEEAMRHPCMAKLPAIKLLQQLPGIGEQKAMYICLCAHIEPFRPVNLLSAKEREDLTQGREHMEKMRRKHANQYDKRRKYEARRRAKAKAAA